MCLVADLPQSFEMILRLRILALASVCHENTLVALMLHLFPLPKFLHPFSAIRVIRHFLLSRLLEVLYHQIIHLLLAIRVLDQFLAQLVGLLLILILCEGLIQLVGRRIQPRTRQLLGLLLVLGGYAILSLLELHILMVF